MISKKNGVKEGKWHNIEEPKKEEAGENKKIKNNNINIETEKE